MNESQCNPFESPSDTARSDFLKMARGCGSPATLITAGLTTLQLRRRNGRLQPRRLRIAPAAFGYRVRPLVVTAERLDVIAP